MQQRGYNNNSERASAYQREAIDTSIWSIKSHRPTGLDIANNNNNKQTHTQSCCARYPHKRACNKPQLCAALLWRVAATAATTKINAVKALQTIVVTLLYCFCCFYFCSCLFQANKLKFKKFGCRSLCCCHRAHKRVVCWLIYIVLLALLHVVVV